MDIPNPAPTLETVRATLPRLLAEKVYLQYGDHPYVCAAGHMARLLGTPDDRLRGVDQDDALDRRLCEAYGLTNDEYTDLISLNDDSPFLQRHEIVTHYLDLLIRKRQATEYQP